MSLLSIVSTISQKCGLGTQTVAISNTDSNVQKIIGYVNEAGQELAARYPWQAITNEATFSTAGNVGGITSLTGLIAGSGYAGGSTATYGLTPLTGGSGSGASASITVQAGVVTSVTLNPNGPGAAYKVGDILSATPATLGGSGTGFSITVSQTAIVGTQNQGTIQAITGPDFNYVTNETMWDRSQRRPVFGPKVAAEWQQLQAQFVNGPWWQYRIRGNQLMFIPAPSPGDQIYFEWVSKWWCTAVGGTVQTQAAFAADSDIAILDERLITLDGLWRFKAGSGLEFAEDFDKAEGAILDASARDASKPKLNLEGPRGNIQPGVFVPAGNWGIV